MAQMNEIVSRIRSEAIAAGTKQTAATTDIDEAFQTWDINLVYGELLPHSVVGLVEKALSECRTKTRPKTDDATNSDERLTFYDLGSGEGFPCILSAIAFPARWSCVRGVEIVPRLHRLSERHLTAALASGTFSDEVVSALRRVQFVVGDMLETASCDWTGADVVYLNGTCYDIDVLEKLFRKAESLPPGAVVILTSHKLPVKLFECVHEGSYDASWGSVTARIYRRLRIPSQFASILGRRG